MLPRLDRLDEYYLLDCVEFPGTEHMTTSLCFTVFSATFLGWLQAYEDGFFTVDLLFPFTFPDELPTITFLTEIFHPQGE